MKVYRMPTAPVPCTRRVVALGFFDGMHRAHAALFSSARQAADRLACPLAVFSFCEDGAIKPGALRLLDEEERLAHMERAGADEVFLYPFAALRALSPADFVNRILIGELSAALAVCGYNFRFGAGGQGDPALLADLLSPHGASLITVPALLSEGEPVSASAIRAALAAGDAERAARLLGRPYTICGTVAYGKQLGRTIGVPTANLPIPPGMALPAFGVYAALGYLEGEATPIPGVANVGVRPTVEQGSVPNCETHFLCPVGDIYGRRLMVALLHRLRGETHFENIEALRAQIAQDAAEAKEYTESWLNGQN